MFKIIQRASEIFTKAVFYKFVALILINKFQVFKVFKLQKLREILKSAVGVSMASIIFLALQMAIRKLVNNQMTKSKLFLWTQYFLSGCVASLSC